MMRPKTVFCDIDGTLVRHFAPNVGASPDHQMELLPLTIEKLLEWDRKGYNIILTTGRKESLREQTAKQLAHAGIIYDHLLMGIGGGHRVLINDRKPDKSEDTAIAINLERDSGIGGVEI